MITVANKTDQMGDEQRASLARAGLFPISGRTGEGLKNLLEAIEEKLDESLLDVKFNLPHNRRHLLPELYRTGRVLSEKSTQRGTAFHMRMDAGNWQRLAKQLNGQESE
jgi:GTP-binding protein HflX